MRTPSTIARISSAAAVVALGVVIPMGVANAAGTYPSGGTPPEVSPTGAANPTVVAGKDQARSTLPFTGTDVVELTAIAGASAGIGFVMVRRSRRASTA
ncbi:MAG: hypothetical protein ABJC79_00390 [Acidimicrobiia bacterium]